MTGYANSGHIARAALEATAYQTRDVLDAMRADSGVNLRALKVDGGMIHNDLLMQFQADALGVPVIRPTVTEITALGAAYAAGLAVGFWARIGGGCPVPTPGAGLRATLAGKRPSRAASTGSKRGLLFAARVRFPDHSIAVIIEGL